MAKPGDRLGKWTVQKKVGRGGQGEVFTATAGEGEPEAAIKVIKAGKPKKRTRLLREIAVHKALSAQGAANIVPILDHNLDELEEGESKGFIVMPLAELSLADALDQVAGRTELCLEVFEGVVNGVVQAHEADVVHRDIKPGNVLFLDRSLRNPMLADFGISLLRDTPDHERVTEIGETVGAKFFMAPEQEQGGVTDVGPSVDIYALGKLLHHMLTGRYLHREKLDEAFTEEETKSDPRWQVIQSKILARTIVEDPEQRIQSATELLEVVRELRTEISGSASPPGNGGKTPKNDVRPREPKNENGRVLEDLFRNYAKELIDSGSAGSKVSLEFDVCEQEMMDEWVPLRDSIEDDPAKSRAAAETLLWSQPRGIALSLAIARTDAEPCFRPHKKFLQWVTHLSEGQSGYPAVFTVPHAYAGFLYMLTATAALYWESWQVFDKLLVSEYEWYYQSGRPLFSPGYVHPYFFHPEAFDRKATETHDFYRAALTNPEFGRIFGLDDDRVLNAYLQTQMMMSLNAAQLTSDGRKADIWPDFGRFYDFRVRPVLNRIDRDQDYATGILSPFGEGRDEFISQFNDRIKTLYSSFGGPYVWESVTEWNDE